jgi:sec-independent protein translocase protein TatB
MFDISWTEFLLIGVIALIVIGPKELPTVMRTLGQYTRKIRGMAADFQGQFQEAMREAEMGDLKKQVDDLAQGVKDDFSKLDPLKSVREDVESIGKGLGKPLDPPAEQKAIAPAEQTSVDQAPAIAQVSADQPLLEQAPAPDQASMSDQAPMSDQAAVELTPEAVNGAAPTLPEPSADATPAAIAAPEPVTASAEPASTERTG